jgi:hypothetical protein
MQESSLIFGYSTACMPARKLGVGGSSQSAETLAERLLNAAQEQGLTTEDVTREIGDSAEYLKAKLDALNATEAGRLRQKE